VNGGDAPAVAGISSSRFREVLGHFASGLTVVTSVDQQTPVGFTCQAFMSLSLEPPLIAIAPGKSSTTWPRIAPGGTFCVNVLSEDQEALSREFAISGSEIADKFSGVGWSPGPAGAPVLEGALGWLSCRIVQSYEAGDHELVVAEVLDMSVDNSGRPLIFYRGGFGRFEP
jgi:3-hydroxy-9,10-secoandrosta-1,3,5(10)-triene-9,17-dione monooxygenase reductase component